ncbi:hypothetical protein PQU92_03590 [Asticcacaulis sp. BYS171W]|uniref:Uncharacterized protein n=1 Tax=Asticcacaulis aquaticus TaxID=2984212 RepID=A0ABT5HQX3_9CAUL|nr:hypothetical protein [Asticcacaulis aquaticus]MDC7682342.1 hypothetical protein [Asticcacaulis aquaticus]
MSTPVSPAIKADETKTDTADVREHFKRDRPHEGKPGQPYGDETEARDERHKPHTDQGRGLSNDRYTKSDSDQPKVSRNTAR